VVARRETPNFRLPTTGSVLHTAQAPTRPLSLPRGRRVPFLLSFPCGQKGRACSRGISTEIARRQALKLTPRGPEGGGRRTGLVSGKRVPSECCGLPMDVRVGAAFRPGHCAPVARVPSHRPSQTQSGQWQEKQGTREVVRRALECRAVVYQAVVLARCSLTRCGLFSQLRSSACCFFGAVAKKGTPAERRGPASMRRDARHSSVGCVLRCDGSDSHCLVFGTLATDAIVPNEKCIRAICACPYAAR